MAGHETLGTCMMHTYNMAGTHTCRHDRTCSTSYKVAFHQCRAYWLVFAISTSSVCSTSGLAVASQYLYRRLSMPTIHTLKPRALRSLQVNIEDLLEQFCIRQR